MTGSRTSYDRSLVPLQGGYVAKRCPVRAQNDNDPAMSGRALTPTDAERQRMEAGNVFESVVFETILSIHGDDAMIVDGALGRDDAQAVTVDAMGAGVSLILGGWLPDDPDGRRAGKPDVLVRSDETGSTTYVPLDVKHHGLAVERDSGDDLIASPLSAPFPMVGERVGSWSFVSSHLLKDALQLAHYWRMLEALGRAPEICVGGIIDRRAEPHVWWIDLGAPRWKVWWSDEPVSVLARYDHEFDFRLDVIAHTLLRAQEPAMPRKVDPVWIAECGSCPWRAECRAELEATDHVSLLPGSRWTRFLEHRRRGILTRAAVAALDWRTARIIFGDARSNTTVDVAELLDETAALDAMTPIPDAIGARRRTALRRLADAGVATVDDLRALDPATASYSTAVSRVGFLPDLIDAARAAVAGHPFRARGIEQIEVPRADVEVDLDMESAEDGVYLWGLWVHAPATSRLASQVGYRAYGLWEPMTPEAEVQVLRNMWACLGELQGAARAEDLTFAVYCYSGAEERQLRRIGRTSGDAVLIEEIGTLVHSPRLVDLLKVVQRSIITGGSLGLKVVAPLAGFQWRDDDAGGEQSMVWYRAAVDDPDQAIREANRERILRYNEDDVRATAALRDWLSSVELPRIDDWSNAM